MAELTYKAPHGVVGSVLSTTDTIQSRAQRRYKIRTSPTISTKKWTLGRMKPYRDQVQLAILQEGDKRADNFLIRLDHQLGKNINALSRKMRK